MKKLLALILLSMIILVGCEVKPQENNDESTSGEYVWNEIEPNFTDVSSADYLRYVEDSAYSNLVSTLDSENYFVENVQAVYLSKEYLDELEYNSKENIYFGYSLSALNEIFEGEQYIFTLGEDGETTVKAFEAYDDTYDKMLKNMAIGGGVILLCTTVSLVASPLGAHAVSMIFAYSAKGALIEGGAGALLGGISAGITKGMETDDFGEVLKAAALEASEGFKWGCISGSVSGGITEGIALKGATLNNLTMNQAALIQKKSKLPLDFIKNFHSVEEYDVYEKAGLTLEKINGVNMLDQKINWNAVDEKGRTNIERVLQGVSPLDPDGDSYHIHHIIQDDSSPFAILTAKQHQDNSKILHPGGKVDHGPEWQAKVRQIWLDKLYKDTGIKKAS